MCGGLETTLYARSPEQQREKNGIGISLFCNNLSNSRKMDMLNHSVKNQTFFKDLHPVFDCTIIVINSRLCYYYKNVFF